MNNTAALSALFIVISQTAFAQPDTGNETRAILDELNTLPKPSVQSDLDTTHLASANRERAASVDEKTNGLWQSWVVSICKGCGPDQRRPQEIQKASETYLPNRNSNIASRQNEAHKINTRKMSIDHLTNQTPRNISYLDLSNENIHQIRAMPEKQHPN